MTSVSRLTAERNAKVLHEIALKPGNDRCADCKTRNPRWASHNLGIFICVSCASIHRKIGTHITKVKSLTLDSWTKEQVDNMRNIGNINSNKFYNPDEVRHPPPTNMVDSERDGELEKFIRDKYEYKRFINKSAVVQQALGPSRSAASVRDHPPARSATAPLSSRSPPVSPPASAPTTISSFQPQQQLASARSVSNPYTAQLRTQTLPPTAPAQTPPQTQAVPSGGVWNDLLDLQNGQSPAANASLPLQYAATPSQPMSIPQQPANLSPTSYVGGGISGTGPSFATGISPGFTAGSSPGFTAGASPGFTAVGASPGYATGAGSFQQSSPANPFSQMLAQQQQQQQQHQPQAQQSFFSTSVPTNPFPRQTPSYQQPQPTGFQQQQPFQQTQQPFQMQHQQPFSQAQPLAQQAPNPFSAQQPQQQSSPFSGSPMTVTPVMSPSLMTPQSVPMGSPFGAPPQQQQQPAAGTNPFTSWMTGAPMSQPTGFAQGAYGQWGAR